MIKLIPRESELDIQTERIEWVDVFKGIMIILMVVGHATGYFNAFIYQFHMAAFFFISGYVSNNRKKGITRVIWNKTYTLLLPYLTVFILMAALDSVLNLFGVRNYLFSEDMSYLGFFEKVKNLFLYGRCYVWWLGAGWFVGVLFLIEVVQAIINRIAKRNASINVIISFALYYFGYLLVYKGIQPIASMDLVFIGGLFYSIGAFTKSEDVFEKLQKSTIYNLILYFLCLGIMIFVGIRFHITVNYPTRYFSSAIKELLVGLNGTIMVLCFSILISKMKGLKIILSELGKNTLGILFFHFQFFKIGYFVLYLFGITTFGDIRLFLLPDEVTQKWWWLIAALSIILCIIEWKIITKIPGVRFFFGKETAKWKSIYDAIEERFKKNTKIGAENDKSEMKDISHDLVDKKLLVMSIFVLVLLIVPFLNQGIMCNDELLYRYNARFGFLNFYRITQKGWINQGRMLAAIFTPLWMWFSQLGNKMNLYRLAPVLSNLINIGLFGMFIHRLYKNRGFSIFCSICLVAFLPISYAPMSPNAYATTFGIPFSFLLIALILFTYYLETNRISIVIISCLSLFIACTSYEIFVTYVPLFVLVSLAINHSKIKKIIISSMAPVITGIAYFIVYFLCRKVAASNYDGNQFGFTVSGALKILLHMFRVSFPGYFLTNPDMSYLNNIFHNVQLVDYVRIILSTLGVVLICYYIIINQNKKEKSGFLRCAYTVLVAILYSVIPALPIAIAKMYQDNIGEGKGFMALPVTYFTYFSATFLCCFLAWELFKRINKSFLIIGLFLVGCFLISPIQYMNSNFSEAQKKEFDRLVRIENFVCSDALDALDGTTIYSEDLFENRLSLAVHDSYWTDLLMSSGKNKTLIHALEKTMIQPGEYFLSYKDDKLFVLEGVDQVFVWSPYQEENILVELNDGSLMKLPESYESYDGNMFLYRVHIPIEGEIIY